MAEERDGPAMVVAREDADAWPDDPFLQHHRKLVRRPGRKVPQQPLAVLRVRNGRRDPPVGRAHPRLPRLDHQGVGKTRLRHVTGVGHDDAARRRNTEPRGSLHQRDLVGRALNGVGISERHGTATEPRAVPGDEKRRDVGHRKQDVDAMRPNARGERIHEALRDGHRVGVHHPLDAVSRRLCQRRRILLSDDDLVPGPPERSSNRQRRAVLSICDQDSHRLGSRLPRVFAVAPPSSSPSRGWRRTGWEPAGRSAESPSRTALPART